MPVYLIRAGIAGPVKIGKADNPKARMGEIQVSHYERLHLLRVWEGSKAEEIGLHLRFADLRIRGEWFAFSKRMLGDVGLTQVFPAALSPSDTKSIQPGLLIEIEDFLSTRLISDTEFGKLAVNDGKFMPRLRAGANMTLATIDKVRAFLHDHRAAA